MLTGEGRGISKKKKKKKKPWGWEVGGDSNQKSTTVVRGLNIFWNMDIQHLCLLSGKIYRTSYGHKNIWNKLEQKMIPPSQINKPKLELHHGPGVSCIKGQCWQ